MTRLSDALARAAQPLPSNAPAQDGPVLPVEAPEEMWDAEERTSAPPAAEPADLVLPNEAHALEPNAPSVHVAADAKLVTHGTAHGPIEQYRRLAARLHLAQAEAGTRVVMITSAVASEGKTLTATNLALTLSESYKRRVLLIDADLRRPWVHELFRLPNLTGLNDGIRGDAGRKVPLIQVSDYLSVLTAGRPDPDPMSVLTSERMQRILKDAASAFDWVIVDTPPVVVLSDAHLLARLVDTVVLVVKANSTQHAELTRAIEAIGRDRILGVVLNCAEETRTSAYYAYGYPNRAGRPAAV
jgi:protein-tyrosine kinase